MKRTKMIAGKSIKDIITFGSVDSKVSITANSRSENYSAAELGLSFLAYNITRAINMIGAKALIAAM